MHSPYTRTSLYHEQYRASIFLSQTVGKKELTYRHVQRVSVCPGVLVTYPGADMSFNCPVCVPIYQPVQDVQRVIVSGDAGDTGQGCAVVTVRGVVRYITTDWVAIRNGIDHEHQDNGAAGGHEDGLQHLLPVLHQKPDRKLKSVQCRRNRQTSPAACTDGGCEGKQLT